MFALTNTGTEAAFSQRAPFAWSSPTQTGQAFPLPSIQTTIPIGAALTIVGIHDCNVWKRNEAERTASRAPGVNAVENLIAIAL